MRKFAVVAAGLLLSACEGSSPTAPPSPAAVVEVGRYQMSREGGTVGTIKLDTVSGEAWILVPDKDDAPANYEGPLLGNKPMSWASIPG